MHRRARQLSEHSRDEANVWVDSQRHYRLARGGSVEISASPYPIVTVNRGEEETHDWLKALKGTYAPDSSIRP
jgi:NAD kinase